MSGRRAKQVRRMVSMGDAGDGWARTWCIHNISKHQLFRARKVLARKVQS